MTKLLMMLISALLFSQTVQAQGDIQAGKMKAATCTACHGAEGNSRSNLYPKLAGQHASYLEKQLQQFKSGERAEPIMQGMSAGLSQQDIKDISAYYAQQTTTPETISAEIADSGQKLYMGGDLPRKIPACTDNYIFSLSVLLLKQHCLFACVAKSKIICKTWLTS